MSLLWLTPGWIYQWFQSKQIRFSQACFASHGKSQRQVFQKPEFYLKLSLWHFTSLSLSPLDHASLNCEILDWYWCFNYNLVISFHFLFIDALLFFVLFCAIKHQNSQLLQYVSMSTNIILFVRRCFVDLECGSCSSIFSRCNLKQFQLILFRWSWLLHAAPRNHRRR